MDNQSKKISESNKIALLEKLIENSTKDLANKQYIIGLFYGNKAMACVIKNYFEKNNISSKNKNCLNDIEKLSDEIKLNLLKDIFQVTEKTLSISKDDFVENFQSKDNK